MPTSGIGLHVITFASSNRPMPLDVPFRYELTGFTVFRSRAFEDGRECFRLHLGYFESEQCAKEALPIVRKHYPDAWISAAPATNLGSFDNTLNTEFRLLRTAYARVVTDASPTTAPAPVAAKVVASAVVWAVEPAVRPPQHYAVHSADHCGGRSAACDLGGVPPVHGTHAARRSSAARPATRFLYQR
jgi:hypothetical protein